MTVMFALSIIETTISSLQFMVYSALVIGGLMGLGFAVLFGGHDHDHEFGHGAEHGSESGDGHESAPSFLSPRVFFAFLVGFGVAGAIATAYGASATIATLIGLVPGVLMAVIAWGVGYFLFKQQVNSSIRQGQVIGSVGTVVTAIRPGCMGEVNVSVGMQIIPYSATSEGEKEILGPGTRVRVVRELGGQLSVKKESVAT